MSRKLHHLALSSLRAARALVGGFAHLLYPPHCWACSRRLDEGQTDFCEPCRLALIADRSHTCPRCSSTVGPFAVVTEGCPRCRNVPFAFDRAIRMGPYEGLLREVVLRLKQRSGEGLAEVIGRLWAENDLLRLRGLGADVVVPIPLHWRRHWQRGYNQSHALARVLAGRLGVACRPRWLRRVRNSPKQTAQSPAGRRENVRGAFQARPGLDLSGKTVLLVDDVLTTGSTASEAARALRVARPARIVVAVLAHGP